MALTPEILTITAVNMGRRAATSDTGFYWAGRSNTRWDLRFNPLISYQSGAPFNITTGDDPYGTTLFTARPGVAVDPTWPGLIQTPYGLLDPNPIPGETVLGRNAGRGPAQISVNLGVSKTVPERAPSTAASARDSARGAGNGLASQTPPRGLFSTSSDARRYNLTLGMSGRNLFNHTNAGPS